MSRYSWCKKWSHFYKYLNVDSETLKLIKKLNDSTEDAINGKTIYFVKKDDVVFSKEDC